MNSAPRSFAELAFEARLAARGKAADAEACEQLIARLETARKGDPEGMPERPLRLMGCRVALDDLRQRGAALGDMADLFARLAAHESAVRLLLMPVEPSSDARLPARVLAAGRQRARRLKAAWRILVGKM